MPLILPDDSLITKEELNFAALEQVLPGSLLYYAAGKADSSYETYFSDPERFKKLFSESGQVFYPFGELAEKPGKTDSKIEKLKTRNFLIPGRRSSSVELAVCGLSEAQKNYLESTLFQGQPMTMILANKDVMSTIPEVDDLDIVIINGLSWVTEWSGEADGLWTVVISTEIQGSTEGLIYPLHIPAYAPVPAG
ncbi:MAG: hypothetical protein LHW64_06920 [Candidatus Cloacimonetes bacterium]|nr:hypothetical protein [Candidatus Cloacimonadota bacterium]MDY0229839.1 hypothetical protein [Candidatus Cloacimonadaceae bacterium]